MTPQIRYYTLTKDGHWLPFKWGDRTPAAHTIMLEDGAIYDFRKRDPNMLYCLDADTYTHESPHYFASTDKGDTPLTMNEVVNTVLEKLELMFRRAAERPALHDLQQLQLGMDILADETRKLLKERRK